MRNSGFLTTGSSGPARRRPLSLCDRVLVIRGEPVMLDADLAEVYGVPTRHLNQQVKRNPLRFPGDFMFQLTPEETERLGRAPGVNGRFRGRRHPPFAFTEAGAGMLAGVLRTPTAARITVEILRAFRRLRPDDAPAPDSIEAQKAHGLFAAIRDALLVQPEDVAFTTGQPYTYFVQVGENGPIKIGWTKNLLVRLRTFATMLPVPLRLLGVIPDDVEDWCHKRFAPFRVDGEWFAPMPALLEFIRDRAERPPESCQWFNARRR